MDRNGSIMILDPDAQRVLDMIRLSGRPPFETLTPQEARGFYTASQPVLQPDPPEVALVRNLTAPGPAGDIRLRLYRGAGTRQGVALPVLVFFHGGGWVIGDLDSHDGVCRRIANDAQCCVIAVDYRLAPEHRFPAAVDDSAAATRWIIENAASLDADPTRVAVGGDSAGGNLAAVMAIMARDGDLPPLGLQVLVYPATELTATQPSYDRINGDYPLTATTMKWFRDHYLPNVADWTDWRASPLRARDLSGTAPALVVTAGHDPLCDEGLAYARRLEQEGVRTTLLHMADQMHGFMTMGRLVAATDTLLHVIAAYLRTGWR
jgi:acetyl esterase